MTGALLFLQGNWRWVAPLAALFAVGGWGGWQFLGRIEAERMIVDMPRPPSPTSFSQLQIC
jgi:hypothetical protein